MLSVNYESCTACGACKNVCPRGCIELSENPDGFLYPVIKQDECINCGLCERACPLKCKKQNAAPEIKAYAAVSSDSHLLRQSTSGGAFGSIAKYVFSKNGVVYGCAYSDNLIVKHIRIDSAQDLHLLQGSKYVQSNTGNTFQQAKQDLEANKVVLYSGTPCQIAGLKCFLGKEYDNLITADIVCHGVPSQSFFDKYVQWYEKRNKVRLTNVDFRSKENSGWSCGAGFYKGIKVSTSGPYSSKLFYFHSYFYHYFLSGDIYRNSCYSCTYANLKREGDFTLGDLWGAEGYDLPFSSDNGCSLLLLNTQKAHDIFPTLGLLSKEVPLDMVVKHNEQLRCPSKPSQKRAALLYRYRHWTADRIHRAFVCENFKHIIRGRIKYSIPAPLKNRILKYRYRKE